MQINVINEGGNYIEIDLKKEEIENLIKGRYPSQIVFIDGKSYTVSVGVSE